MSSNRPTHAWNDPDNDGHNCVDCPEDSIWKCDRYAHPGESVLPPLTEVEGLKFSDPFDLMTPEERRKMHEQLRAMSHARKMTLPGEQLA